MFRVTLAVLLVLVPLFAAHGARAQEDPDGRRPNVLFVLTDDQREGMLGPMPNVRERVQARGATFENFYVSQSWCCPSRATFLTGRYPHNHGVTSLAPPDGGEIRFRQTGGDRSTLATWLDGAGYQTALVGKYMNGYGGRYVPPGWDTWVAQQQIAGGGYRLNRNGAVSGPVRQPSIGIYRNAALRFLDGSTDSPGDAPFFLMLATNAPHLPAKVEPEPTACYRRGQQPRPPSFNEADVSDKPRWVREKPRFTQRRAQTIKKAWCDQRASLGPVDAAVGAMLDLLQRRGELENTYVVFASDNGVHLGEHRYYAQRGAKRTAYEEAAGVPFVVRGPGIDPGTGVDALAVNNDFAPTVAEWAGVEVPYTPDGRSLAGVARGEEPAGWRTAVLNESHSVNTGGGEGVPGYDALLTGAETYVEWETGEKELYYLGTDPHQLENLLRGPSAAAKARAAGLSVHLDALKRCSGNSCRTAEDGGTVP